MGATALVVLVLVWLVGRDPGVADLEDAAARLDAPSPDAAEVDELAPPGETYAQELARLEAAIGRTDHPERAPLAIRKARLTRSPEDLAAAESLATSAIEADPPDQDLQLERAWLRLEAGRFADARADLAALPASSDVDAARLALALATGDGAEVDRRAEALRGGEPGPVARVPLALWSYARGDATAARQLLEAAAEDTDDPVLHASLMLRWAQAELERGDVEEATARLEEAEASFPGWWLVELEHARALAARGGDDEARARLARLLEQNDSPRAMSLLSTLAARAGDMPDSDHWRQRADAAFAARLDAEPALAAAAARHHIEHGPPDRAVTIASALHEQAPTIEAKLLLAQAFLAQGDAAAARRLVDEALSAPYPPADLYITAAEAYEATGDPRRARELRTEAAALLPPEGDVH